MFDDRKKKNSACLQFLRRPERYNKLLLSRVGEDEGRQGEAARAKRPENLKDGIRTQAERAPGAAGAWQGAEEGQDRLTPERSVRLGRAGPGPDRRRALSL